MTTFDPRRLKLLSFDVFGTLIDVRSSSKAAFEKILAEAGAGHVDVKSFWETWEEYNIQAYWGPYRGYREICRDSLSKAFATFAIPGKADAIRHYFEAFPGFRLFPDVIDTLARLSGRTRLAVVSNIDDDLLAATPVPDAFGLICTAERARGYKPDGTLFRYLIENAGVDRSEIFHSGQSQFTDLVGAKPLGLRVAWINRRGVALDQNVPRPDIILADVAGLLRHLA